MILIVSDRSGGLFNGAFSTIYVTLHGRKRRGRCTFGESLKYLFCNS